MIKNRIRGFIELIRPFTLLVPLVISISIILASYFYNDISNNLVSLFFTVILPAGISLALINGASNVLNQVTDIKTDKISKPYRPIPKGIVSIGEANSISFILYSLALALSLLVNLTFILIVSIIVFFTITYSVPPRVKEKLFLNQIWIAVPRGLLGIMASWSVFGSPIQPIPLIIGSISMFYLLGGCITKDITDSIADKITGTKTLVNTYGVKKAAMIVMPFMFAPFLMIPLLIVSGFLHLNFWPLTLFALPSVFICYLMIKKDVRKIGRLENTTSWAMMYVTYLLFALTSAGIILIS